MARRNVRPFRQIRPGHWEAANGDGTICTKLSPGAVKLVDGVYRHWKLVRLNGVATYHDSLVEAQKFYEEFIASPPTKPTSGPYPPLSQEENRVCPYCRKPMRLLEKIPDRTTELSNFKADDYQEHKKLIFSCDEFDCLAMFVHVFEEIREEME